MVLRHVGAIPHTRQNISSVTPVQKHSRPLAIVTTLFFMWGFLTCLNDILIPHLSGAYENDRSVRWNKNRSERADRIQP